MTGCFGPIAEIAALREEIALIPEGTRTNPQPQDRGWLPSELTDVAVSGQRVAVIDRRSAEVTVLSSDLSRRTTWGTRGNGPGELQAPAVVKFDPRGDSLWVLDRGRRHLILFSFDGRTVRELLVPSDVVDFEVTDSGRIFVAHQILVSRARGSVAIISELGAEREPLIRVSIDAESLTAPRFPLPGTTPIRLRSFGRTVAVAYLASGIVDLYRIQGEGLERELTVSTCVQPELMAAYSRQRESSATSQTLVVQITDVSIEGDTLLVVGPRSDAESRYGVQRFDRNSGASLGALVFPSGPITLPREVRFLDRAVARLLVMDPVRGFIAVMRVARRSGSS